MSIQGNQLQRDMDTLKKSLAHVGNLALTELNKSIQALTDRDIELAHEINKIDDVLDANEVKIEAQCLTVLARHQPVAQDLRYLTSVLKINQLIENTGDTAVRIAKRAEYLAQRPPLQADFDIKTMSQRAITMFDQALKAFLNLDQRTSEDVQDMDEEVDRKYRKYTDSLIAYIEANPEQTEESVQLMNIVRHLERAADRAVDIAEQVVYILTGDIVRHSEDAKDSDN
ncbi:phosphate signaling complex protein PhoU [Planctomycetota bacterium]|nr:phosphate signaling complex protein PhoU [Planctomycetota bacterium]